MTPRPMLNSYQRGLLQDTLLNLRGALAEMEMAMNRVGQELKRPMPEAEDGLAATGDALSSALYHAKNLIDELEHLQPREDAA